MNVTDTTANSTREAWIYVIGHQRIEQIDGKRVCGFHRADEREFPTLADAERAAEGIQDRAGLALHGFAVN